MRPTLVRALPGSLTVLAVLLAGIAHAQWQVAWAGAVETRSGRVEGRAFAAGGDTGSFPEYDRVWEDGVLNIVAVFGKSKPGAVSPQDAGIAAYNGFVSDVRALLRGARPTTKPTLIPLAPGVGTPDIELRGSFLDGRRIRIDVLLVDSIGATPPSFDKRYRGRSGGADLIAYVGPGASGQPARVLVERGRFVRGQYLIALVNCCTRYGNLRAMITETRLGLNDGDPKGTRYMDVVTNAGSPTFASGRIAALAFVSNLLDRESPASYEQILDTTAPARWLVTGEEDNRYGPPALPGGLSSPRPWRGLDVSGTVAKSEEKRFRSETLDAGTYLISLTGTGDADLYVRVGSPPTTTSYACRPFKNGSTETCSLQLGAPARLHIMVRGLAPSSTYRVVGQPR